VLGEWFSGDSCDAGQRLSRLRWTRYNASVGRGRAEGPAVAKATGCDSLCLATVNTIHMESQ